MTRYTYFSRASAILSLCVSLLLAAPGEVGAAKELSVEELRGLFQMAITNRPRRIRLVANVTLKEPAWTAEQVAAELGRQNQAMAEHDKKLTSRQRAGLILARSNAIVGTHLESRLLHIQEWYSGNKYRLDLNEGTTNKDGNDATRLSPYRETFVNVHDPAFSPYESFSINHALRDALLTRNPGANWAPFNTWQALGLDEEVVVPILLALVDLRSVDYRKPGAQWDPEQLKFDSQKALAIQNGSDPNWHFEQNETHLEEVRVSHIKLRGKLPALDGASDTHAMPAMCSIQAEYWIGKCASRTVCLQAILTNLTKQTSFLSRREVFDADGYPKRWSTKTAGVGVIKREQIVDLREVDTVVAFTDEEIFAPNFPTNYTVSDVTSGKGVTLQLAPPHPAKDQAARKVSKRASAIIIGLIVVVPLVIALFLRGKVVRG